MALAKAFIAEVESGARVEFKFNPTTISISTGASYNRDPVQAATESPPARFTGTLPTTLKFKLLLDTVEEPGSDVSSDVQKMLQWTVPLSGSDPKCPPQLMFSWGQLPVGTDGKFIGHLDSISVVYKMFAPDGAPIRADVDLSLTDVPKELPGTNPSSGAPKPYRTHAVVDGESLHEIAYRTYGDAAFWRPVGAVNDVDDPLRLRPGTRLLLPAKADLVEVR